jgi:AbrB family looped-hinge helix DNA binding protein
MAAPANESTKMKVFQKGQVVIPISLRRKHHIEIGDQIDVVSTADGILLKTTPPERHRGSLTDELYGVFADFAAKASIPSKADIAEATEQGFQEASPE